MTDRWSQAFTGLAALAALWVLVYWWWEPRGPRVTYDDGTWATQTTLRPVPLPAAETTPSMPAPQASRDVVREPRPAPAQRQEPQVAVIPPRFRDYTIKPGDTLARIARRELGSERFAEAIARANPLKNTETLRPGRTLRIPLDPANIQGTPVPGAPPPAVPAAPAPSREAAPAGVETVYTVRAGDTLSAIAQRHYGSSRFAGFLAEANQLGDGDSLRIGQVLRLPPRPAAGAN